jgi:hypothetical protein
MFFKDLDSVTEAELAQLERNGIPENLTLEFKAKLNLNSDGDKREAAKDSSALANTVGGQILYGISEVKGKDDSKVAGPITPLPDTEGDADERLSAILAGNISPRIQPRMRRIPVSGGFVLAVEIPQASLELHMVTGFKDGRYYKRTQFAAVPMTQPEVQQAIERIAAQKTSLEERIDAIVTNELLGAKFSEMSFLIIPWHTSPKLADPLTLKELGRDLFTLFGQTSDVGHFNDLRLRSDGYRMAYPPQEHGQPAEPITHSLSMLRSGVVHLADQLRGSAAAEGLKVLFPLPFMVELARHLIAADYMYEKAQYWREVRVLCILRPQRRLAIEPDVWRGLVGHILEPNVIHRIGPVDASLRVVRNHLEVILKPLLDQIYQARGMLESPFFENGRLKDEYRKQMPPMVADRFS